MSEIDDFFYFTTETFYLYNLIDACYTVFYHFISIQDILSLYEVLVLWIGQCCGSASIIIRIRIQDPKNVHMDPDPRG